MHCEGQSHTTVSTNHNFSKAEAESNSGPPAYQPNGLRLSQTGPLCTGRCMELVLAHRPTLSKKCQCVVWDLMCTDTSDGGALPEVHNVIMINHECVFHTDTDTTAVEVFHKHALQLVQRSITFVRLTRLGTG